MIQLTKLNGEKIFVNYLQILYLQQIPETKVKLVNGDYYLVQDTVESIIERSQAFLHNCLTFESKEVTSDQAHELDQGFRRN